MALKVVVCPYCKEPMDRTEQVVNCSSCDTAHHFVCWEENLSCCSVFQCKQNLLYPIKVKQRISLSLIGFMISNFTLHLFITYLHPIVQLSGVEDALFLLAMETVVICTGATLIANGRTPSLRFFSTVLLTCNVGFVLTLLLYAAFDGLHSLYALIWI